MLIALFAALVCVATMLVPIPIPASGGYANAGDGVILMCAFLMGPVNAAFAAGIGSMLADLLLGYVSFAPGTLVIKACVALIAGGIFNRFGRGQATGRALGVQLIGGVAAEAFMVLGYFFYEAVLLGVGIGAAGGPVIMGWALAGSTWQNGYRIISILQIVLTAVLIFSLPLWQTPTDAGAGEDFTPEHRTLPQLMKVPGVPEVMCCFALYSGVETVTGMWAASYCTLVRGLDAATAASWASLFYLGITVGRFLSGFLTMKFNDHQMIRMGQVLIAVGIALVFLPAGNTCLRAGLVTIGLGCAPIYPCIIHETPANFGKSLSMAMTGIQMAAAYTGTTLLSPLFGVLAQNITMQLYPWALLVMLLLMVVLSEQLHKKTAARRAKNS